ncbi:MAG: type II secretion system minor pseudopilin GspH [Gammaproteobacteria bacterium]|nr:type II secretion system minor pseudopilin GspH [Gammaproteobacteria bacterium]
MRNARGFTLVEIMVVVAIIGVMIAGGVLALGLAGGRERELTALRERLQEVIQYARERAELEGRDYALAVAPDAYQVLVFDVRSGAWKRAEGERLFAMTRIDPDYRLAASVEGRPVLLGPLVVPGRDSVPAPVALFFASGELNDFELRIVAASDPQTVRVRFQANNAPLDEARSRPSSLGMPRVDVTVDGKAIEE